MSSRLFALLIWAAVAASLAYWGLRWFAQPASVPPQATPVAMDGGAKGDFRRLLSGPAASDASTASPLAGRIKLLGAVAPRLEDGHTGVALLSIDAKPARAVRVGGIVDGNLVLQSLNPRSAQIGPADGPTALTLDLPTLPAAATGTLPAASGVTPTPPAATPAPAPSQPVGQAAEG